MDGHETNYRRAKKRLRKEIKKAKLNARQELIDVVDLDPWSLPYKVVLKRLRKLSPGLIKTLDADTLNTLLNSLFPKGIEHNPSADWTD